MKAIKVIFVSSVLGLTLSCAHKENSALIDPSGKQTMMTDNPSHAFTCLVGKETRTVTLHRKENRCEVHYTKFGNREQVAWGENTQDICDRAYNNIRSNIESRGFQCAEGLAHNRKAEAIEKTIETTSAE